MSLAIPATNGSMSGPFMHGGLQMQQPTAGTPPAAPQAPSAASIQGMGELTGAHNTPMHVAGILLLAGGTLAFFKFSGFRFAFDVGLGRS